MTLRVGLHCPVQGATQRFHDTASALNAEAYLWLLSERPSDAALYPAAQHFVRLDNWGANEAVETYVSWVVHFIEEWQSTPNVVFVCGNEPDLEAGHHGEQFPAIAAALRTAFPGILLANPPLSVEATHLLAPAVCDAADVVACHSYVDWQHPETLTNPNLGQSYRHALAAATGKPVAVLEMGVSNFDSAQWSARNQLIARWVQQATADGVAACCLFIADGASTEWIWFDIGPEAAIEIRSLIAPPPIPVPPPVPVPPPTSGYSGTTDPHGGPSNAATQWIAHISATNPVDAQSIVNNYQHYAPMVNYSADLAMAQASLETGGFTSPAWRSRRNPAGIGITGDNVAGPNFPTNTDGIQAHLALLNCYFGDGSDPWGVLSSFGFGGFTKGFTRLNQMNGVWAVPGTTYGEEIARIANDVTGGTVPTPAPSTGITLEDIYRQALARVGNDHTDEGNAEFGMCEQNREEEEQAAGLPRIRYASAAIHGDVLMAAGTFRQGIPPRGAGVVWGRSFDLSGHIATAADYPMIITTHVSGRISLIDAKANGWYDSPGYLGYYIPDGVTEGEVTDVQIDGHLDDAMIARLWYGGATKATQKKMAYNPQSGIGQRWKKELLAGKPLGAVQSGEEADAASGRIVQYFTSGAITYIVATGETFVN